MNAHQWVSQCLKKTKYESKRDAMKTLLKCKKERGVELRVYHCPHCLGYHLTSKLKETNAIR